MKQILFVLVALSSVQLSWAATDRNEPVTEYNELLRLSESGNGGRARFDQARAMEDIEFLEKILKGGYAGYEILREEGFEWDSRFGDLRKIIETKTHWSSTELASLLHTTFAGLPDGHFGFVAGTGRSRKWTPVIARKNAFFSGWVVQRQGEEYVVVEAPRQLARLVGSTLESVEQKSPSGFLFPTFPRKEEPAYLLGAFFAGVPRPMRLAFRLPNGSTMDIRAPLHRCRSHMRQPSARTFRLTHVPFPRLEVGSFSALRAQELERFVDTATDLVDSPAIVVDLRGNPGGSDIPGKRWLSTLAAGGPDLVSWESKKLISPVTLQGDVLLHTHLLGMSRNGAAREQAGGRLAYANIQLDEEEQSGRGRRWEREPNLLKSSGANPFQGRLVVVVDRGTRSSAETFVMLAKQFPNAAVVGENTGGMARFGEIKVYPLPHSGIWVQAGTKVFEDPARRFKEGKGFYPDYWIDDSNPISDVARWLE